MKFAELLVLLFLIICFYGSESSGAGSGSLIKLRDAVFELNEVFEAEGNLTVNLTRIQQDILHLNISFSSGNNRYLLIDRAINLAQQVNVTINRVKTLSLDEHRKSEITVGLQQQINMITELILHLESATDNATIDGLAFNLTQAELLVRVELAVLGIQPITREERLKLLYEIQDLGAHTLRLSYKLLELNLTSASDEFYRQNQLLVSLDAAVRNAVNPLDFIFLEFRYKEILANVDDLIIVYGIH